METHSSASFSSYADHMQSLVRDLKKKVSVIIKGGTGYDRHLKAGKMLVRNRIELLLDPGSPFLEIGQFAGHEQYDEPTPAAGVVAGIGLIHQQFCIIIANDPTVKGGAYYPLTVKKHLRAQYIAMENHLPCLYLVDSSGANLLHQSDLFPDKEGFGRIFFNQAKISALQIPQIAIVLGSCTAGAAYIPAMSEQTIIVKNQGTIFLGGPPLVKAATGEIVTAEELGGAQVHTETSGLADYLAENEHHAFNIARHIAYHFNRSTIKIPNINAIQPPKYDAKSLYSLIPDTLKKTYAVQDIILRLVDGSVFDEFKPLYGKTLVCGIATIWNEKIGIIANNGILFSESAQKGTHFIQLCCQQKIPLLFLQNISGFMIGKRYEAAGIAKHGAKMVNAVACASVPKLTVIIGGSFGAGNYGMCGRAYDPRFLWSWPNARIAIMGGEQATNVISTIKENTLKKQNQCWNTEDKMAFRQTLLNQYEQHSSPYYASARLWDDGIIDPADTRDILGLSLLIVKQGPIQKTQFGVFRM